MPNSPRRLGDNEQAVEHERISFVDPGSFGSARKPQLGLGVKAHLMFVLLAIVAIALIVAMQMGWI